uniref:upstream activation factor subunit UAF30-like n=1 Tax=Fragaria vesca subsp. vesca TaxID=101020 RepID=UPI0005CB3B38|nr:PREDICTED: upstream activation factor subunit UAF30-like [Fragaria vesca subsp. vesca]
MHVYGLGVLVLSEQPVPKKPKVATDSGTKSSQSGPSVVISEALANFFGVGGREMLQSEVLQRIWEYIKVNRLEDPLNPMAILCDAKLQDLFSCESISALGIPEVLARHHIFRRS